MNEGLVSLGVGIVLGIVAARLHYTGGKRGTLNGIEFDRDTHPISFHARQVVFVVVAVALVVMGTIDLLK